MDIIKEIKKLDSDITYTEEVKDSLNKVMRYVNNNTYMMPPMFGDSFWCVFLALISWDFVIDNYKKLDKKACEDEAKISELIKSCESYKKLKYEYDILINEVSKYLKSKGFKNSKEVIIYLTKMVNSGGLSLCDEYCFYSFKYHFDNYTSEINGSKITTGLAVCRHFSSFATDVMNRSGYESYNSLVYDYKNSNNLINKFIKKVKPFNHQISCISDNGERYYYDPTNYTFVNLSLIDEEILNPVNNPEILYYMNELCTRYMDLSKIDRYDKIHALPISKLDSQELCELEKIVDEMYEKDESENIDFYREQKSRVKEIAKLSHMVQPMSNQKIKSWNLD